MSGEDRIATALRAIIREGDPRRTFFGLYEYRTAEEGEEVHASPTDGMLGLPALFARSVPSGLGERVTYREGQTFLVGFINGDPSRPRALFGDPATTPKAITIDAGDAEDTDAIKLGAGLATVIRDGDVVLVPGLGAVTVSLASPLPPLRSKVKA